MPRASRYFIPGKVYHLTHRCHDCEFLFRFDRDRDDYRKRLWSSLREASVSLLAYCITSNHVHLLAVAEAATSLSEWMQQLQGEFAQAYNRRKHRSGAFWSDRYHCTMVEPGAHLWNCMVYIELNMVRAGVVSHPRHWAWCSYGEWMGTRQRYRAVDQRHCLGIFGSPSLSDFRAQYEKLIADTMAKDRVQREPQWTESIAVGSQLYIEAIASCISHRQELERRCIGHDACVLRDQASALEAEKEG